MTNLESLLDRQGIRTAAIVDDVFDAAPRPEELNDSDWDNFFDDLDEVSEELLRDLHTEYAQSSTEDLRNSSEFVAVLWANRTRLAGQVAEALFEDYETRQRTERRHLDALLNALESHGLSCSTMGRTLNERGMAADLVFVDLFLGFHQTEDDVELSVQIVRDLVESRIGEPPLVILMSRSPRLHTKRNQFRDDAGLLGSMFRVVTKEDLATEGVLEAMLTRLASHYPDAKRVAQFWRAWDSGLDRARARFGKAFRRLDLPDLGQVRGLLLEFEGVPLGEYLLDVADKVLQHEIERDEGTIAAARQLNQIDLTKYPAPHLTPNPDLQELVHRMTFLHPVRLQLSEDRPKEPLQFGDLLLWQNWW